MIEFYLKTIFWRFRSVRKLLWPLSALLFASLVIIIFMQSDDVSTYPVGWEKSFSVTPYSLKAENMMTASRGDYLALVYEGKEGKNSGIYISLSFDGGKKFFKPIKIASMSSEIEMNPKVSISGKGRIAVVWQAILRNDPASRIYYSVSKDMGASWSDAELIDLRQELSMLPSVLYDEEGRLHIFYNAFQDKAFNLFHISLSDEKKFSEPRRLVNVGELRGVFFPALYSSGSDIYVVLQGKGESGGALSDNLYFIMSDDNGDSWSSRKRITFSKSQDSSPFITVFRNMIYVVYQNNQEGNWAIKLLKGYEKGDRWDDKPVDISTTNADCFSPVIVNSNGEKMVVIWYDIREKKPSVFSRKFVMRGGRLEKEQRLSKSGVPARNPSAVSQGRNVLVFWEQSGRIIAKASDVYVAAPVVYSNTHPEDEWSSSSRARIRWKPPKDESGIAGYATILKKASDYRLPDITPTVQNLDGNITEMIIPDLEDGISYFYIRAIDGAGNYSRTARYEIKVSSTPPPMPLVSSSTHPEAEEVESDSPVFEWSVDRRVLSRLKGYLYSLSKKTAEAPKIFTTDTKIDFQDLSDGRYFFTVRAVDKTNSMSRVATYEIIVGSAPEVDPGLYDRIADKFKEEKPVKKEIKKKVPRPSIDIVLPFDNSEPYYYSSFDAGISVKNIRESNIAGYAVFIDNEKPVIHERVNQKEDIIKLSNLENGEYHIGVKCMYYKIVKGKKYFVWTDPVIKKFTISVPAEKSPVLAYMDIIYSKMNKSRAAVTISMMVMVFSIAVFGFGSKIAFYTRLLQFRITNIFK